MLSDRLEIAAIYVGGIATEGYSPEYAAIEGLKHADALLAAASQSGSDIAEMARTIQRLERRVKFLRSALEQMVEGFDCGALFKEVASEAKFHLEQDTEAAQ